MKPSKASEILSIMTIVSLAVTLLLFVPSFVQATDNHYCDENAEYEVKVKAVHISPNPLAPGERANFTISANTGRDISGGMLVTEVSYFGWHVYSNTHDLCTETPCPIQTGPFFIEHSQVLPPYTPSGSYWLKLKMFHAGKELTCVRFTFYVGEVPSLADI